VPATVELETAFREERGRALATLIRLLGDFDLAEDSLSEAFAVALETWPREGAPRQPLAWLVSTARHKALDRMRRARRWEEKSAELARGLEAVELPADGADLDDPVIADDRLRLLFTCCHPALAVEAQVALALKTLCGLAVEEIARAFLVTTPTMAQRLVRAKAKIRLAGIPYAVPDATSLPERLGGVLRAVYLVFNEGYAATSGAPLVRAELCLEAIRLGRLVCELLPRKPEVAALLALMLLHDARRPARLDADGELVTLEDQDRALWDRAAIAEGIALAEQALRRGGAGFYAIQAAIAALHAKAATAAATDWPQIAALYALLLRLHPSPVIALNHAAAVGMAEGPERGLRRLAALEANGELRSYALLPAAKADLLRRAGRSAEARAAYDAAIALTAEGAERRFLERRRAGLGG
jgi:RNA polymerase sigma-70 factor (ECF subfamily)